MLLELRKLPGEWAQPRRMHAARGNSKWADTQSGMFQSSEDIMTANEHRDTHSRDWLQERYDENADRRTGCLICLLSAAIVLAVIWGVP